MLDREKVGFHYQIKLKQISRVIDFCKKERIDISNVSFRDFLKINDKFQNYNWFSLEYIESLKNRCPFDLDKMKEKVEDKYKKIICQNG